jgi:hypothetical protein
MSKGKINEYDVTKKMLDKLRGDAEAPLNKDNDMSDYDYDKLMLETIRSNSPSMKSLITENDSDTIDLSGQELKSEYDSFRQTVSPRVEFTMFKIYPQTKNVVFGGTFQNMDGMEWQFSLEETDGVIITAKQLTLSSEAISILQKLKGYYDTWADEWSVKVESEYKSSI